MIDGRFEVGKAYMATPTLPGAKKIVLACHGRHGNFVTFARVEGLYSVRVSGFDGREIARVPGKNGIDYCTSSTVPVDMVNASAVLEAIGER